jgi:hypothetical protein
MACATFSSLKASAPNAIAEKSERYCHVIEGDIKQPAKETTPGDAADADNHAEDDGEWEVAAKSHNAARRKKRKQARRAAWEARQGAQQATQGAQADTAAHHLAGVADGGDSDDWQTDGDVPHLKRVSLHDM